MVGQNRPAPNNMFAQWWRDIKVLSIFILLSLPTGTGRGFNMPPLRKHKRYGQAVGRLRDQRINKKLNDERTNQIQSYNSWYP